MNLSERKKQRREYLKKKVGAGGNLTCLSLVFSVVFLLFGGLIAITFLIGLMTCLMLIQGHFFEGLSGLVSLVVSALVTGVCGFVLSKLLAFLAEKKEEMLIPY